MSNVNRETSDWIDTYLEFTDNSEPPLNYRRWTAISVIAAALQRKCRLEWGSLTFYPNLYIVLVGPPGRARKGTAMNDGKNFLEDLQIPMSAEAITREALIRRMADISDSVIDTKTGISEFHSSLTVFAPELTVFLGHQNYTLMSDLTDWFDCARRWKYETKNSGVDDICGVWLNLIGATTPDLIRTALPLDAIGGGLTSRIIFIYEPDKGKIVPAPFLTDKEKSLRLKLMKDLQRIHALQGKFRVTKNFLDKWIDWYTVQDANPPFSDNRFAGYIERRPLHIMKLCMICSVSRNSKMVIHSEDFDRATSFLANAERKMPQAFSGVGKNTNADTMSALMSEIAIRKKITEGELLGMFYHDVDQYTFNNMLRTLETINYITYTHSADPSNNLITYRGESTASINNAIRDASEGLK
jgi:hypothetical protein